MVQCSFEELITTLTYSWRDNMDMAFGCGGCACLVLVMLVRTHGHLLCQEFARSLTHQLRTAAIDKTKNNIHTPACLGSHCGREKHRRALRRDDLHDGKHDADSHSYTQLQSPITKLARVLYPITACVLQRVLTSRIWFNSSSKSCHKALTLNNC